MTRIVTIHDGFCKPWHSFFKSSRGWSRTEVWTPKENKALPKKVTGTKVTSAFGEAGANIRTAAIFAETLKTSTKKGEHRDAETERFLTYRAADRGGHHPD